MRLRPLDFVALLAAAAAVAMACVSAYSPKGGEPLVVVTAPGGEWIYPLGEDRELEIEGALGATRICISGGSVRIESSPCPNQTCVAAGAVSVPGQWLACLPNEVFVRIEGRGAEGGVDAGSF